MQAPFPSGLHGIAVSMDEIEVEVSVVGVNSQLHLAFQVDDAKKDVGRGTASPPKPAFEIVDAHVERQSNLGVAVVVDHIADGSYVQFSVGRLHAKKNPQALCLAHGVDWTSDLSSVCRVGAGTCLGKTYFQRRAQEKSGHGGAPGQNTGGQKKGEEPRRKIASLTCTTSSSDPCGPVSPGSAQLFSSRRFT
jgi:hypothetical protein